MAIDRPKIVYRRDRQTVVDSLGKRLARACAGGLHVRRARLGHCSGTTRRHLILWRLHGHRHPLRPSPSISGAERTGVLCPRRHGAHPRRNLDISPPRRAAANSETSHPRSQPEENRRIEQMHSRPPHRIGVPGTRTRWFSPGSSGRTGRYGAARCSRARPVRVSPHQRCSRRGAYRSRCPRFPLGHSGPKLEAALVRDLVPRGAVRMGDVFIMMFRRPRGAANHAAARTRIRAQS
jgi:hypothetical protein